MSDVHRVACLLGRLLGEIGGRSELRIYGEGLDVNRGVSSSSQEAKGMS